MPAPSFKRRSYPMLQRGMSLAHPAERLPNDMHALVRNSRFYSAEEWRSRPGLAAYVGMSALDQLVLHSAKRLNNPTPGAVFSYFHALGAGTKLYVENSAHTSFSSLITGLSGNPLSLIPSRPVQSPYPWLYIADSNKLRKVGEVVGALVEYGWGIAPPTSPPTCALGGPVYLVVSDFDATTESSVAWTQSGVAGAPSTATRLFQTITYILYDSGSTGWASVVPNAFPSDLQSGMRITVNSGGGSEEKVRVKEVFEQTATTTIQSIRYDSGTSGLCVIQPTVPIVGLRRDMLLRLPGGTAENVRVLSVTVGPDGIASFRCSTVNTHSAGENIEGLRSFRAHFANTHSASETLTATMLTSSFSGSGTGALTHALARDLSRTSSRPLMDEDEFHISILISNPDLLVEGKVLFDINPSASSHNFDENALYVAFRASDLQPVASGTQTEITAERVALARRLQEERQRYYQELQGRQQYYDIGYRYGLDADYEWFDPTIYEDAPLPPGDQLPTGDAQWYELRIKRREFKRIGSDMSRGWADTASFRIELMVTGAVTLKVDSCWVGGTHGPDSAPDDFSTLPYYYAYRYRSLSRTGAKSNFSPPIRTGIMPQRDSVVITPTASGDAQVDVIDIARFGGSLPEWHLLATIANGASFTDSFPDSSLVGAESFDLVSDFQPFPSVDLPRTGTCDVIGTTVVRKTGDSFNTAWARNSRIIIGGVEHRLYSSPSSSSQLEIIQSGGTQTDVTFYLPAPTLLGQPLPVAWGPAGGGLFSDVIFACGDARQPGTLFFTNPGDPDSTLDTNQIEITSGSEQLVNGLVYKGGAFVFSDKRLFRILPRFGYGYQVIENLGAPFLAEEVQGVRGLFARWTVCAGDLIYFLSDDGIYATNGAEVKSLTTPLYPLFPHDGQPGESITRYGETIYPPDFSQTARLRLEWSDGRLYFDHLDTQGQARTWVFNTLTDSVESLDSHSPSLTFHYSSEGLGINQLLAGGADGKLYVRSGTSDVGSVISSKIGTFFESGGDLRGRKLYKEIYVEAIGGGSDTLTITPYVDEGDSALTPATPQPSGRTETIIDLSSGAGVSARSLGLLFSWATTSGALRLLSWEPALLDKAETSLKRSTDWTDCGYPGPKRFNTLTLRGNTGNIQRTVEIQYDGGTLGATLNVTLNGERSQTFIIPSPFIAHLVRVAPTDSNSWQLEDVEWGFEPEPALLTFRELQATGNGSPGYKFWPELEVLIAATVDVTFVLNIDGTDYSYTIPHTGGAPLKRRIRLQAVKGRVVRPRFSSSSGFRIYLKDSFLFERAWGEEGAYRPVPLVGEESNQDGALA